MPNEARMLDVPCAASQLPPHSPSRVRRISEPNARSYITVLDRGYCSRDLRIAAHQPPYG